MRSYEGSLLRDDGMEPAGPAPGRAPGKRTLTMSLAPVQRKVAVGPGDPDEATIDAAAARGIGGPASGLPHADVVQRAFGRHRLDHVQAHAGGEAAEACADMNALAYATGDHVVFGDVPSLHTVAHEAAHIVQQRAGVARKGGGGDDTFERHADAVAERVVAGRSAEDLLDEVAPGSDAPAAAVQRIIKIGKSKQPPRGKTLDMIEGNSDLRELHEEKAVYVFRDQAHVKAVIDGDEIAPTAEADEAGGDAPAAPPKGGTKRKAEAGAAEKKVKAKGKGKGGDEDDEDDGGPKKKPKKKGDEDDVEDDGDEDDGGAGVFERNLTLQTEYVSLRLEYPRPGRVAVGRVGGYQILGIAARDRPPVAGLENQGQHKVAWRAIWLALARCEGQTLDDAHTTLNEIIALGCGDEFKAVVPRKLEIGMGHEAPPQAASLIRKAHSYLVARQNDGASWESDDPDQLAGKGEKSLKAPLKKWQAFGAGTPEAKVKPLFTVDPGNNMNKLFDTLGRTAEEVTDVIQRARLELQIHNPVAFAEHEALIDLWLTARKPAAAEEEEE